MTIVKRAAKKPSKSNAGWRRRAGDSICPIWETLSAYSESIYTLIKNHHISSVPIDKLRNDKPAAAAAIDDQCAILHGDIRDIIRYTGEE